MTTAGYEDHCLLANETFAPSVAIQIQLTSLYNSYPDN